MPIPVIAIIGRQNVGKSSLFNRLCKRRIAIVDARPGTTLDRVERRISLEGRDVILIDTGGLGFGSEEVYGEAIRRQVDYAIARADIILLMTDVTTGITRTEQEISRRLRGTERAVLVVANKADHDRRDAEAAEFSRLGLGEPFAVSVNAKRGIDELVEAILDRLPPDSTPAPEGRLPKIAVVGRPNVGKSTLINALCGEERVVVSERPGTTRDAVDIEVIRGGRRLMIVDTAGLRRRTKVGSTVEFFSQARAREAIGQAEGILFLLEATRDQAAVEKNLAAMIVESGKPCVIALNKWDLVPAPQRNAHEFVRHVRDVFPHLAFAPVRIMSARTGLEVWEAVDELLSLVAVASMRVGTGELNRAVHYALQGAPSPLHGMREGRLLYATQISVSPPTFVLFVKNRDIFSDAYIRHVEHSMRQVLPFARVPIRLILREKRSGRNREKPPGRPRGKSAPRRAAGRRRRP